MHRYQQQYRLWRPIIMGKPILRIDTSVLKEWDEKEWMKYSRQGVLLIDSEKPTCHVSYCLPNRKNTRQSIIIQNGNK